ncbi:hypothetical protein Tco_1432528, partial [Tanacetum coccineum]
EKDDDELIDESEEKVRRLKKVKLKEEKVLLNKVITCTDVKKRAITKNAIDNEEKVVGEDEVDEEDEVQPYELLPPMSTKSLSDGSSFMSIA